MQKNHSVRDRGFRRSRKSGRATIANDKTPPAIETVDREIAAGFRWLRFAPALEQTYENDTRRERERFFILSGQIALVLYDCFLFCDWLMTPDVFWAALIARLGIFTPFGLFIWFVLARRPSRWVREGISSLFSILAIALTMLVLLMSRCPDLLIYQYGSLLIMLYITVVHRLQIRYAVVTLLVIFLIQMVGAAHLHGVTPKLLATAAAYFLTATVLLLWATYALEREHRRSYLLGLRGRILNDNLDKMAKEDALTGLWNRRHLGHVMTSAWTSAEAKPTLMSVIMLDIDYFKAFNDTQGHLEGDKCLQKVGACVRAAVEGHDKAIAVRFGGEEFLVFIEDANSAAATRVAERIKAAIEDAAIPHPVSLVQPIVTASFGVATGPAPDLQPSKLVAAADDALYASKHGGRDRVSSVILDVDRMPLPANSDLRVAC